LTKASKLVAGKTQAVGLPGAHISAYATDASSDSKSKVGENYAFLQRHLKAMGNGLNTIKLCRTLLQVVDSKLEQYVALLPDPNTSMSSSVMGNVQQAYKNEYLSAWEMLDPVTKDYRKAAEVCIEGLELADTQIKIGCHEDDLLEKCVVQVQDIVKALDVPATYEQKVQDWYDKINLHHVAEFGKGREGLMAKNPTPGEELLWDCLVHLRCMLGRVSEWKTLPHLYGPTVTLFVSEDSSARPKTQAPSPARSTQSKSNTGATTSRSYSTSASSTNMSKIKEYHTLFTGRVAFLGICINDMVLCRILPQVANSLLAECIRDMSQSSPNYDAMCGFQRAYHAQQQAFQDKVALLGQNFGQVFSVCKEGIQIAQKSLEAGSSDSETIDSKAKDWEEIRNKLTVPPSIHEDVVRWHDTIFGFFNAEYVKKKESFEMGETHDGGQAKLWTTVLLLRCVMDKISYWDKPGKGHGGQL
jgi:hypothetical protein